MGTTDANGVYTPDLDEVGWDPEIGTNFDLFSQTITDLANHEIAVDPHTGYQKESQRAAASGYASLDSSTKVPIAQLPTGTSSTTVALGNAAAGLDAAHAAASDPHPGYLKEDAEFSLTGTVTPPAISAAQDDYNPAGLVTANTLRLATNSTTQRNISGLAGGTDGRVLLIHNVGPGPVAFIDEGGTSAAANRFSMAGDMILLPDSSMILQYDETSSRWRVFPRATAATNPAITFGASNVGGTSPYFVRSDDQLIDPTIAHAAAADPHAGYVQESLVDAKGDLIVGSAADTVARLPVGTNLTHRLVPDSSTSTGFSWLPHIVRKASPETINTSTTLHNDAELHWTVAANEVWFFQLFALVTAANTTMDFKSGWSVPSGTTMFYGGFGAAGTATTIEGGWHYQLSTLTNSSMIGAAGTPVTSTTAGTIGRGLAGMVIVSSTPGTVNFQWAQDTSSGSDLTVGANSVLLLWRIA